MVLLTELGYSEIKGVAERGIPQGGEDSPLDFTCMDDIHLCMIEKKWKGGFVMRAGGKKVKVKGAAYGDDLRCTGGSREEAQECIDLSGRVFHFFGLTASPTKMFVRAVVFDEMGEEVEACTLGVLFYLDRETGQRVALEVGGSDQWAKYLGETGNLMGESSRECGRIEVEGGRAGRLVAKARLWGLAN